MTRPSDIDREGDLEHLKRARKVNPTVLDGHRNARLSRERKMRKAQFELLKRKWG